MSDFLIKIRSLADLTGLQAAQRGVNALGENVKASFSGLAGILAGGALTAGVKSILSYADHLQDLSDRAKSGAEDLQRLSAATTESGIEIDQLSQSLGKLALFQAKVANGDKDSIALINSLGLDAGAVAASTRVDLFYDLADSFSNLKSPADQAKASVMLFGEQGMALVPVLEQGKRALLEMGDAATVMSDKTVAELAKVNSELEKGIQNMKNFGATALAAAMDKVASVGVAIAASVEQERIQEEFKADQKRINAASDAKLAQNNPQAAKARAGAVDMARDAVRRQGLGADLGLLSGDTLKKMDAAGAAAGEKFDKDFALTERSKRLADAAKRRDDALNNLFKVAETNFQDPLNANPDKPNKPLSGGTSAPDTGPTKPTPSPLDNVKPETLKDRITSIGGVIGNNTNAISYLSRAATATERTAQAVENLASNLGTGRSNNSVFSD